MGDFKPRDQTDFKTSTSKIAGSQLNVNEIVLDLTGCDSDSDEKKTARIINDIPLTLPLKNSGFEKKSSKNRRTKLQMLGNLTFREIAEKRKEMFKKNSFKSFEKYTCSKLSSVNESSLNSHTEDNEKNQETTYINPHVLVGKTITLDQGNIRRIKFLSQDSNTSNNRKLLKLDALKLTPKIIVRKSKPRCLLSNYIKRNNEDPIRIYDHQRVRKHEDIYSVKNSVKLNVQLSFESPNTLSSAHDQHLLPNGEYAKKRLARTHRELLMQNPYFDKNVFQSETADFMDTQNGNEENEDECSFLNSSHDSLTILSQVACGELEMSQKLGSKRENKYSPSFRGKSQEVQQNCKKSNYDHVLLDHSYEKKFQPENQFICKKGSAKGREMKNKTCPKKRIVKKTTKKHISELTSQKHKINDKKPMFAWCTQYIRHDRLFNDNFTERGKLPTNQEVNCFEEHNKYLNMRKEQNRSKLPTNQELICFGEHNKSLNFNLKKEQNLQQHGHTHQSNLASLSKTLNLVESPKETQKTQENLKMPFNVICENEVKKNYCLGTADIPKDRFSKQTKFPEENDEVMILKEVLVSKSLNCNVEGSKRLNNTKIKNYNNHNCCENDPQRISLEKGETQSVRKTLIKIPASEEAKSKNNCEKNVTSSPHEETGKPFLSNSPSQVMSSSVNSNVRQQETLNSLNLNVKLAESRSKSPLTKPQAPHNHILKCDSVSMGENVTNSFSGKVSYLIKECSVLVERLNLSIPLVTEVNGSACSSPRINLNEKSYDCNSCYIPLENSERQREECELFNSESKFRHETPLESSIQTSIRTPRSRHRVLPSFSINNNTTELKKGASEVIKPPVLLFVKRCKTNSFDDSNSKISIPKQEITTSKEMSAQSKSLNGNESEVSRPHSQNDNYDSVACYGTKINSNTELHCQESLFQGEHNFGTNEHVVFESDAINFCKRKIKDREQYAEGFKRLKKIHLLQGPKKPVEKHIKTINLKNKKYIKSKPENAIVETENSQSNVLKTRGRPKKLSTILKERIMLKSKPETASVKAKNYPEKVKRPRGRPRKHINKVINTSLKKRKILNSKLGNTAVKTEIMSREANTINKDGEVCVNPNKNSDALLSSNMKNIVSNSPVKHFSGNREIYSLLADFTTLGCSIEPKRKLRKRLSNTPVKSTGNIKILDDGTQEPISCNGIIQLNVEMKSAETSMNEINLVEINKEPKHFVSSGEEFVKPAFETESIPTSLSHIETERHIVPQIQEILLNQSRKLYDDHSLSHSNVIESKTVKTKNNVLTFDKKSSLSSSTIKKLHDAKKQNTFSSQMNSKNQRTPKSAQKRPRTFGEINQSPQQSHLKEICCDKTNKITNEKNMPATARKRRLLSRIQQNSQKLKSCMQTYLNTASEFSSFKTCSTSTPDSSNQRKVSLNNQKSSKLCLKKSKSDRCESYIRTPDEKVTIAGNISNKQICTNDKCVTKQPSDSHKGSNNLLQNQLQPQTDHSRRKSISSPANITTESCPSTNREDDTLTKKVSCKSSSYSNLRMKEDENSNIQTSHPHAVSSNIRSLIKEQLLKKSRKRGKLSF